MKLLIITISLISKIFNYGKEDFDCNIDNPTCSDRGNCLSLGPCECPLTYYGQACELTESEVYEIVKPYASIS